MHVQANMTIKPDLGFISAIISSLGMFVLLFMILSAFSMCCGYYNRVKNCQISPKDFYARRVKRILPFFALMTFIDVVLEHNLSSLTEGVANITLFFNFFQKEITVIGVGWFIGIVCVFYMLFPCFVALMDNKKRALIVNVVAILLTCISVAYFGINYRENFSLYFPFFTMGGLIYLYRKEIMKLFGKYYLLSFVLCVIISVAFYLKPYSNPLVDRMSQLILFSFWTCFAISRKNKVLTNRVMNFLSGISMEIYLSHMMFFRVVQMLHLENVSQDSNINYIIVCIITLFGAIVFSYFVKYKFINKILLKKA